MPKTPPFPKLPGIHPTSLLAAPLTTYY